LGVGGISPEPAHASVRDWMWRSDQLGAEAFEEGRHAEAAELFEDPAWRATSLYREGRFDEAASALAGSEALEDQYNLGNALAHAGQLDQAVSAYDQVLSAQPDHADAKHNRDLVAKLLEQQQEEQPPEEQQSCENPSDGEQSDSSNGSEGESSDEEQQEDSSESDGTGQQGESETSAGDDDSSSDSDADSGQANEPGSEADTESDSAQADAPGSEADTESESAQADVDPAGSGSREPGDAGGEDSEEQPVVAERDGAGRDADPQHADTEPPSVGGAQAAGEGEPAADDDAPRGAASSLASQPLSEQEQSVEQWLSRVSDDPGGLLREKLRRRYAQKRYLESMGVQTQ
jgi:Ca-activated chloride channel family protein